jgi:hypothetical protein
LRHQPDGIDRLYDEDDRAAGRSQRQRPKNDGWISSYPLDLLRQKLQVDVPPAVEELGEARYSDHEISRLCQRMLPIAVRTKVPPPLMTGTLTSFDFHHVYRD